MTSRKHGKASFVIHSQVFAQDANSIEYRLYSTMRITRNNHTMSLKRGFKIKKKTFGWQSPSVLWENVFCAWSTCKMLRKTAL